MRYIREERPNQLILVADAADISVLVGTHAVCFREVAMNQRILMIDDSLPLQQLLSAQFRDQPFDLHAAMDGQTVVTCAEELRPELILLDIDLPDIDGFEVCRQLKASAATAQIPIMFISSEAKSDSKARGFDLGAVGYITKPFLPGALTTQIQSVMNERRQASEVERRDRISGFWNRSRLTQDAELATDRAIERGLPLSCVVLDIDGLRLFNKNFGGVGGDLLLRNVAEILRQHVPQSSAIYTNGAGRYFMLMPEQTLSSAARQAQRLFSLVNSIYARLTINQAQLQFSVGVADLRVAGKGSIVTRAESALRCAKLNSGGRVSVARPLRLLATPAHN